MASFTDKAEADRQIVAGMENSTPRILELQTLFQSSTSISMCYTCGSVPFHIAAPPSIRCHSSIHHTVQPDQETGRQRHEQCRGTKEPTCG